MTNAMVIARIRHYFELIRFSHTLFALPFALLGAALAAHGPDGWRGRVQDLGRHPDLHGDGSLGGDGV